MTDYTADTGEGGKLIIRDNGSSVEFLVKAGYSSTFGTVNWSGRVNNQDVSGSKQYPSGGNELSLGSWGVSTSQRITFRIGSTGTSGLGGPTEFSVDISRGSPPGAPTNLRVVTQTPFRIDIAYDRGPENGSPISRDGADWYEIVPGSDPILVWIDTGPQGHTDSAGGPTLKPATRYDVYIYSIAPAGQGAATGIAVYTAGGTSIKIDGVYRQAVPYIKVNGEYKMASVYVKNDGIYRQTV